MHEFVAVGGQDEMEKETGGGWGLKSQNLTAWRSCALR